jgi:hypothetical protein
MRDFFLWAALLAVCGSLFYQCTMSDSAKRDQAEREAQARADAMPHVIREADGCKVYAFKAGDNWHYFTRCGDGTVTTERNWDEHHQRGKQTITEHKSETIVTQGNR